MNGKGQIIEIPSSSSIFVEKQSMSNSKKEELVQKVAKRNYSLFDGFLVGEHPGIEHFKLGQRKGINIGGKSAPLYVIGINRGTNQLFVGEGESHPGLFTDLISFPNNRVDFQGFNSVGELFENGSAVGINSPIDESEIEARIYNFDSILYLELERSGSIALENGSLEINFKDNNHKTIIIN